MLHELFGDSIILETWVEGGGLKENAHKISASIRRTENIQFYITSTMQELFTG
jgi:hypothetical protein